MLELKDKESYLFVKETTKESIYSDTYSFGVLVVAFWLNYTFIGGNNFLDLIIFLCFFIHIGNATKKVKKFGTLTELIEFLNHKNK